MRPEKCHCTAIINDLNKRFFTEYLPASDYEQAGEIDFEMYGGDGEKGIIELWFTARKKT